MDAHKKKTGRLRRRAIEFGNIARKIEEKSDERVDLRADNPRVTVAFGPVLRRTQLDGDLFELDDSDGRVVAEIAAIMQSCPEAILLADDSKPIRLARQTGLAYTRPMESWRRKDGPDERDKTIDELRRELGAQPLLTVEFPDAVNEHIFEPPPKPTCQSCAKALLDAALSVDKMVPREESIRRHGLARPNPLGLANLSAFHGGVAERSLQNYDQEYQKFEERLREWADLVPNLFRVYHGLLPVSILVGNAGDRAAERVHVELTLARDFRFAPFNHFAEIFGDRLEAPEPPTPNRLFHPAMFPIGAETEVHRPDAFYEQDAPASDLSTTSISWRCEELRQGAQKNLPALIFAERPDARGALEVRVSSPVIAKATRKMAPLVARGEPSNAQLAHYLLRRVDVMPEKYQSAIADALRIHLGQCLKR